MNQNVLIISQDFILAPTSNAVIGLNLTRKLLEQGNSVWMTTNLNRGQANAELFQNIKIHRIKYDYYGQFIPTKKIRSLFYNFAGLLHIFVYPLTSLKALHSYKKKVIELVEKHDISLIIALNNPFMGGLATVAAKKKYGEKVKAVLYDLDSYTNRMGGRFLSYRQKLRLMRRWEEKIFDTVDVIMIMNNHEQHYAQKRFDPYRNKMGVASFPMLSILPEQEKNSLSPVIQCYFAGTLDLNYRNPKPILEVFQRLEEAKLYIYGRVDNTSDLISRYSKRSNKRIQYKGLLPFLDLQEALHEADFLISIGNSSSDMVPAKTYEYISYLKPIIHFYSFDEDPVLAELEKYPLALLIDSRRNYDDLVVEVSSFMQDTRGKRVDKAYVLKTFAMNTPEFSLDLIEALPTH